MYLVNLFFVFVFFITHRGLFELGMWVYSVRGVRGTILFWASTTSAVVGSCLTSNSLHFCFYMVYTFYSVWFTYWYNVRVLWWCGCFFSYLLGPQRRTDVVFNCQCIHVSCSFCVSYALVSGSLCIHIWLSIYFFFVGLFDKKKSTIECV